MADEQQQAPLPNGAAPPPEQQQHQPEPAGKQSLRDVAEAAWEEVQDAADDGEAAEPVDGGGQQRDAQGRFVAKTPADEPGEQSEKTDPAPHDDPDASSDAKPVDPAPQGSSNQPPQHWSEQDRQTFSKLDPAGQEFLLRRHTEMERDYQTKAQAAATAVQFTQSLAPYFQHPALAGSLQQAGISPQQAIEQWASFHLRAIDPNPVVRAALHQELGQRMGLDPAAVGQMSQPGLQGLSEEDLKDPVIRNFADTLGKTFGDVQALRGELNQMRQQDAARQNAEVMKVTRWQIDQFADEKDAQGQKTHPHFDAVLDHMIELYHANPERDLQTAYDMAIWAVPSIRSSLIAAERNSVQQQASNERARQAVRSNVRGVTSPVAKPAGDGKAKGLREALEDAADEVGF